jgi:uncharacterized membrane protein YdfJ with MMPL/SSD domain
MLSAAERANSDTLQVEVGGQAVQFAATAEGGAREAVGLAAAVVVLLLTFGSVVAMGLPLKTALIGLRVALAAVPLLSVFIDVPIFGPSLAIMIGLGVGIDYALFILTRFRACLHEGAPSEDACATALTTAGRAVLFAGVTVCISMLGLFIMGISFVNGMAVSAILAVLLTMVASVTLLPAPLGFAGLRSTGSRSLGSAPVPRRVWTRTGTGGAGSCNATRGPWPWVHSSYCWSWPRRSCPCDSGPQTRAPIPRAAQPVRPTTSQRRASVPASTGAC